ncbi:MAG TPA: sigma-70 family RNA polymerase sigma factor [Bryobacteraceae bacterium]|nr:sigma-70 family RNA polymerase sigma factor [Bryobacteraceae bacterium]
MPVSFALEGWIAVPFPAAGKSKTAGARSTAFEAEAMPHLDDVLRTALRMTGDRGRAEDAVQETFLQAWKSFDTFEPGTNCRAWLLRILFYCVHHQRRKWFRFPKAENDDLLEASLPAPEPIPETLRDEQILAALDGLPADYRAVVVLVDIEEFAYRETAGILQVPIGTVMSRLNRGRRLLRQKLGDLARSYGIGKGEAR